MKAKPANVELVAKYECAKAPGAVGVAGELMEPRLLFLESREENSPSLKTSPLETLESMEKGEDACGCRFCSFFSGVDTGDWSSD